jgi:tetraacyldisaccharide 4'-kinase
VRDAFIRLVWYGDGFAALLARAVLTPVEWLYGAASLLVGAQRARQAVRTGVPTVSIGNLTVGGTGKTPIAAWVAAQLARRGRVPALLLRGYGADEQIVHEQLNPRVPVLAHPVRRASATRAVTQGATALVLDDAFQHRQLARDADVVLVSADLWHDLPVRLLPVGPFREPLFALRRASLLIVTRKAASPERAEQLATLLRAAAPALPVAIAHLAPGQLRRWGGEAEEPSAAVHGQHILAVSGIGAPGAFEAQLRALGADVEAVSFGDHHAYTPADASALAARAMRCHRVVCTLKDAVKLGPIWPADAPGLWYLSQSVVFERGASDVHALLDRLAAR